ncbi:MAG: ChuX/HutX family heme-like substrate-binding protein [Verrucomicrobiota bacterium]
MNPPESTEPFQPQPAGKVFRLQNDWERLLHSLPQFHSSATVYRGNHAIHCQSGRFPNMTCVDSSAFFSEGFRGTTLNLEHWAEAWWYHEERFGKLLPCLEVADEKGTGLFKLCYRDLESSSQDQTLLQQFIQEEADEWSLLHLQRSNMMNCVRGHHPCKTHPPFVKTISAIQKEAIDKNTELGLILPHQKQSSWDCLRPLHQKPACCWFGFGENEDFIAIQPAAYQRAEVFDTGNRTTALFFDKNDDPALSIIQPEGHIFQSLQTLKSILT